MWSMMACCVESFLGISMPQLVFRIKCQCLTKSDVFGCQCVWFNMLTLDEFICANGHDMAQL